MCFGTFYYEQKGKVKKEQTENMRAKDERDKELIGSRISFNVLGVILRS